VRSKSTGSRAGVSRSVFHIYPPPLSGPGPSSYGDRFPQEVTDLPPPLQPASRKGGTHSWSRAG